MNEEYQFVDVDAISDSFKNVGRVCGECINSIARIFHDLLETMKKTYPSIFEMSSKRISRKRFIKLLMSNGIQRNQAVKLANKCHSENGEYKFIDVLIEWRNHNDK